MRAEPRHIDIRQSLKQLKTATIVTAAIGRLAVVSTGAVFRM